MPSRIEIQEPVSMLDAALAAHENATSIVMTDADGIRYRLPLALHSSEGRGMAKVLEEVRAIKARMEELEALNVERTEKIGVRPAKRAAQATKEIIEDLKDRRGLRQEWDQIDPETRVEIHTHWAGIILSQTYSKEAAKEAP